MDTPASARLSLGGVGCQEMWREDAGEVRVQISVLCGLSTVGHIPE